MTADATAASTDSGAPKQTSGDMSGLFAIPAFRGIAVANVLASIAYGSSRFVFVWLVGDLTDWNTATAILGILIGLPPLFLSAWAGSLADQLNPRRFGTFLFVVSAIGFGATAILVNTGAMTVPLAMVCGFVTAIAPSMLMPLLQALVPTVVPTRRLMQAVVVQNLGMMGSVISGTFVGGAIIQAFGIGAGFWLLAIASVIGALRYGSCPLPDRLAGDGVQRQGAIREGARIALGTEPLRTLLALTAVFGIAIASVTLLLPEFARDVLDKESLAASAINVAMSVGMVSTSMLLAMKWSPKHPGRVLTGLTIVTLGGGLIAIGSARSYVLVVLFAWMWGLCGGLAMTLMRTLTQVHTPPELMGRVMGLAAMAQNGAFPIGALMLVGVLTFASVATTMVLSGVLCVVCCSLLAIRPHVRRL